MATVAHHAWLQHLLEESPLAVHKVDRLADAMQPARAVLAVAHIIAMPQAVLRV